MEEKSEDCKVPEDLFNGLKVADPQEGESASPMVSDPKGQHCQSKLPKAAEAHPQDDHVEEECFHDCSASFEEEQPGAHVAGSKASDDSSSELDEEYLIELEKNMPEEEKQKRREESAKLKEEGNERFKRGDYMEAESSYSQALQMCPACFQKDRSVLFSNRAAARMKQDKKETAITDCSKGRFRFPPLHVEVFAVRFLWFVLTAKSSARTPHPSTLRDAHLSTATPHLQLNARKEYRGGPPGAAPSHLQSGVLPPRTLGSCFSDEVVRGTAPRPLARHRVLRVQPARRSGRRARHLLSNTSKQRE